MKLSELPKNAKLADFDTEIYDLTKIRPHPENPREHPESQYGKLCMLLERFSYTKGSVVVQKGTDLIIAGSGIYESLMREGFTHVRAVIADLDDPRALEFMVADNKAAELSNFNLGKLTTIFVKLKTTAGAKLEATAFQLPEIKRMIEKQDPPDDNFNVGEALEEEAVSQIGDLWLLADHRVLCGDSKKPEELERLMDSRNADMVLTDPPYGINLDTDYSPLSKKWTGGVVSFVASKKYPKVVGDESEFDPEFILDTFSDCAEIFLWGGDYFILPHGGMYVWDKTEGGKFTTVGSEFELCWSKSRHRREIISMGWAGCMGLQKEDTASRIHPTQKPMRLMAWFIEKYSEEGGLIVDPFLGSGSTLIAAHQLGRVCYGMEIEPAYCDVIVRRYIDFADSSDNVYVQRNGEKLSWDEVQNETERAAKERKAG